MNSIQLPTLLAQQGWELLLFRLHVANRLTGFKLCAASPNDTQQQATGRVNGYPIPKQRWELLGNNVASVCMGL